MIRIVTLGREFGSGGGEIARRVAEQLGWKLVDNTFITEIAQQANVHPATAARCDERVDPWFHRLMKTLWQGGYEGVATTTEPGGNVMFDSDTMAHLSRCIIEEAAEIGNCVIVGRGGQCTLQGRPDALHVFVYAPWEEKVKRVRKRVFGDVNIETLIQETDQARTDYILRYFNEEWFDRGLYHLMVNSSLGEDVAVSLILDAVRQTNHRLG